MKRIFKPLLMAFGLSAFLTAGSLVARADDANLEKAAPKAKIFTGTISAVDATDRAVKVKRFLSTKSFHLGENCQISVGEKKAAAVTELRPGQKVEVQYKDVSGVLVASRLAQQPMVWRGRIESIDTTKRLLIVKDGRMRKTFDFTDQSKVILAGGKQGKLEDVRIGHKVSVVYEAPEDHLLVRRIDQTSETFSGSLNAIDAAERTVKAKHLLREMKFQLAKDCQIVVNGKAGAELSDLRLGQH